ncbi:hypothetical protein [Telluria aromaticivorans]|uniref:Uncharacterized protein n=1 Tax=Telluria aromaticivorans TaxID=2725995 RepID=A0A7Y2JVB0_9BURK|nr:hypothetical protein [Telluria aromaticivorans]NNG21560.1 hypothetical protein [Telluria aromaticivorans]
MNFVVTDEMVDLTVLVGVIFGIVAAGFIAYGKIQQRRSRKTQAKGFNPRRKKKTGRAVKR